MVRATNNFEQRTNQIVLVPLGLAGLFRIECWPILIQKPYRKTTAKKTGPPFLTQKKPADFFQLVNGPAGPEAQCHAWPYVKNGDVHWRMPFVAFGVATSANTHLGIGMGGIGCCFVGLLLSQPKSSKRKWRLPEPTASASLPIFLTNSSRPERNKR